jgi:hypothetical protein
MLPPSAAQEDGAEAAHARNRLAARKIENRGAADAALIYQSLIYEVKNLENSLAHTPLFR